MIVRRHRLVAFVVAGVACAGVGAACTADGDDRPSATAPNAIDADGEHASGPSAGCEARVAREPGSVDITIRSGGRERKAVLEVPPGYDGREPFPVVLGLHALTVDHHFVLGMVAVPDPTGAPAYLGVAPSGLDDRGVPFWNAAPVTDNYDVAFLADLLDELEASMCIDRGRVFATGMSNGAQMSSLLACSLPDRIAAIAPIAGVEFPESCSGAPVPVIAFHGTADPIVLYGGGGLDAVTIAEQQHYGSELPAGLSAPTGVEESMAAWAEHNGCDVEYADERVTPSVIHRTWFGCAAPTDLYIVEGAGHTWPGKPVPGFEAQFGRGTTEIDASELMFEFFRQVSAGPGVRDGGSPTN